MTFISANLKRSKTKLQDKFVIRIIVNDIRERYVS